MTKEQITATINAISDLMQALRHAATEDKAEIYAGLNLQLTYNPSERKVAVRARVGQTCTKGVVSEDKGIPIGHDSEIALTKDFAIGGAR